MATFLTAVPSDPMPKPLSGRLGNLPDTPADERGAAPLDEMMREMGREMAADGMLVTWHEPAGRPQRLFADGWCQPSSEVEQAMLTAADEAVSSSGSPAIAWALSAQSDMADALLTTRVATSSGPVVITSLFAQRGLGAQVGARESMKRMLPLVRAFFGIWVLRIQAIARIRGLTAVIDSSDIGTVLVDRHGRILVANTAGESLFAKHDGLRRAGALLGGGRLADTMRLQAAIEHVVSGTAGAEKTGSPVVSLHRKSGRPLLAVVVSAQAASHMDDEVAAFIHVYDPDRDLAQWLGPVCNLYRLSPVETRLTTLLASGETLLAVAGAMHIQEQTARSYLKQVFNKTQTKRQAELVWLMLASAVRTAPRHVPRYV